MKARRQGQTGAAAPASLKHMRHFQFGGMNMGANRRSCAGLIEAENVGVIGRRELLGKPAQLRRPH